MTKEYFELSSDQKDLFYFIQALPISGLNLATRINVRSLIDEDTALEALRLTVINIPYCRLQICKMEDGSGAQYVSDNEPSGIELIDLSKKSQRYVDRFIRKMAHKPFPNNGMDVPLYNFKLIRCSENQHVVFFNMLHIIADAYALSYAISYFCQTYILLASGQEVPDSKCDIKKLIDDIKKRDDPVKLERHNAYFRSLYSTEPHFTSINGISSPEFVKGKQYGKRLNIFQYNAKTMRIRIPALLVNKINNYSAQIGISPMVFYLLAYRTYVSIVSKTNDVMFISTSSRRSTIVQKHGGLSIAHLFLNRSNIEPTVSFFDAMVQLNIIQNNGYRHADSHIAEIEAAEQARIGTPANCWYTTTIVTFQYSTPFVNSDLNYDLEFLGFDKLSTPLYINMLPVDSSGDIMADYYYCYRYIKSRSIQKYHDFMLKFLESGIQNPDLSIEELIQKIPTPRS